MPYREDTSALAGCGRAISQRVRSRGCEDLAILCSDRISPALANYTRQLAERDLAGRSIGRPAGRSVGSLELTLNLYVFLHTFRYRHDILLTTPRFEDLIYASRYAGPLRVRRACARAGRPFTPARETASTSLTVIAILDPLEHAPSTFLSRLPDPRDFAAQSALRMSTFNFVERIYS